MTSEQFVKKYNITAANCYFHNQIILGDISRRVLHRQHHRVAGGDSISFILTESGGQVHTVTMFDNMATTGRHRQLHSISASIMVDVLTSLPATERKEAIKKLGLPTGAYGTEVPIGMYVGHAVIITNEDYRQLQDELIQNRKNEDDTTTPYILMVQLRDSRIKKGVEVHMGSFY